MNHVIFCETINMVYLNSFEFYVVFKLILKIVNFSNPAKFSFSDHNILIVFRFFLVTFLVDHTMIS